MNCQDIENLLDDREFVGLPPARQAELDEHLSSCARCADQWRAAHALHAWREAATPAPLPGLFAETLRRASRPAATQQRGQSFWAGAGVGGALAAGIVAAVMSVGPTVQDSTHGAIPALTITLNQPHDVSVAIDSGRALMGAQIRVVLTGGLRLAGFDDRSVVSWTADLDPGVNRLTLPVVAVRPTGGQVLVEVAHRSQRQVFIVDVGVATTVGYALPAPAIAGRDWAWHRNAGPLAGDRPDFVNSAEPRRQSAV